MTKYCQIPWERGKVGVNFSQIKLKRQRKLKSKPLVIKKGKDVLKKTDPFQWMLKLCRLILALTTFLKKLHFSWGRGKLGFWRKIRSRRSSCLLCSIENYAPDPNPLLLRGWRGVGMWFWKPLKVVY